MDFGANLMQHKKYFAFPSNAVLVTVIAPFLLLPLPLLVSGKESRCGYVILLVATYWMSGCLPLGVTGILPVILFALTGMMTTAELTDIFFFNALWLLLGSLLIAIAIQVTNLHRRIALKILLFVGTRPRRLLLGFMLNSYVLSMFMINAVVTAMMIPIAEGVFSELKHSLKIDQEKADISFDKLAKSISICIPYACSIGGISTITGNPSNIAVVALLKRFFVNSPEISYGQWFAYCTPSSFVTLVVAYIWLKWLHFGISNPTKWFCYGKKKSDKSLVDEFSAKTMLQQEYNKLGSLRWNEVWVLVILSGTALLWFSRNPGFAPGWGVLFDGKYVNDGTVAIATSFLLFLIPNEKPKFFVTSKNHPARRKPVPRILTWSDVHNYLVWEILFICGGALVLAEGSKVSGLSAWFTTKLAFLINLPSWITCLLLCVLAALLTECTSNFAVTNVLMPVLVQLAEAMKVHPFYICLPPIFATSLAFMLPVATPANAMAFALGHLKIRDMIKSGWLLNVVGILIIILSINTYGVVFWNLNEMPSWVETGNISMATSGTEEPTLITSAPSL